MSDIQKAKIGSDSPDAIMFNKYYVPTGNTGRYFTSIVEADNTSATSNSEDGVWEVNDDCEVEIVDSRTIKVNKFVIDKWFIRKKLGSSTEISNWSDFKVNITGLAYLHENIIKHTEGSDTADGFTNAYLGTIGYQTAWYPGEYTSGYYAQGFLIQGSLCYSYPTSTIGTSLHMGRAPWDIGYYSQVEDGDVSIKAYAGVGNYALSMGFFGGRQTATSYGDDSDGAYEVYDISDNPVYISLDVEDLDADIDPSSVECWDAYAGNEQVWHRDKTVENCWIRHGIAQKGIVSGYGYKYISIDMANIPSEITSPMLPEVIDWEDYILNTLASDEYVLNWNCDLTNSPMHDTIKEWFADNVIPIITAGDENSGDNTSSYTENDNCINFIGSYPFRDLKVNGDFKIVLDGYFLYAYTGRSGFGINCDKLTIQILQDNCGWTSMNNMFNASSFSELEVINANGDVYSGFFRAADFSGAFEYNSNITEIPDNIIAWGYNRSFLNGNEGNSSGSMFQYAFEYCSNLTRIGMYGNTREAENNTVRAYYLTQTFNHDSELSYIGPVLDLSLVNFYKSDSTAYPYLAFNYCSSLEDVRIKNLNGSYVDFATDGSSGHGNLSALNQESVEYLFENLTDLTTYDEYEHDADNTENPTYIYGRPFAESGELYCPSEWSSYITGDMVSSAKAKGWTIYIGGSEA